MEYDKLTDFELIRGYLAGNELCYEEIRHRYRTRAIEVSLELVDSPDLAVDVAEEGLDRLCWILTEFHPDCVDCLVSAVVFETALDRLLDRVVEHCEEVESLVGEKFSEASEGEMSLEEAPPHSELTSAFDSWGKAGSAKLARAGELISETAQKLEVPRADKRTIH